MDNVLLEYWTNLEHKRVQNALKLHHWYSEDKVEIEKYVKQAMLKSFRISTVDQMNIRIRNIVPKVIDKVAQVYKLPAIRVLDGGVTTEIDDAGNITGQKQSPADIMYQDVLEKSTISRKCKQWHRLGLLFNTVLVQPIVVRKKGATTPAEELYLDFHIHTPAFTCVETSEENWNVPVSFYYPIEKEVDGKMQQALVYWSATEHYLIDRFGNKVTPENNVGGVNPYGILPIAVLRFKDTEDFWGEGAWALVEGNEEIAVQNTNIAYTAIFQAHGQAVAINTGLTGEPKTGPNHIIKIDHAGENGAQASDFKFVSPQPMIPEIRDLIDWWVKALKEDEGITQDSATISVATKSGTAKLLDNADLQERRQDDIQILEDFEHDLFDVVKAVWNVEVPTKKIKDGSEFSIRFSDIRIVKTTDEKIKEREQALKIGTGSRIDFIREDYPELTREQADKKLLQIIAENQQFNDKFGGLIDAMGKTTSTDNATPYNDKTVTS